MCLEELFFTTTTQSTIARPAGNLQLGSNKHEQDSGTQELHRFAELEQCLSHDRKDSLSQ